MWIDTGASRGILKLHPYEFILDEAAGLARGVARGTWSIEETAHYCADLRAVVARSRQLCGRVRVLLDRREISLQSADVCALLADANRTIFAGDDKIALVVATSLAKTSLRHRMPHAGTKAFLSMSAAETWLSI